jgi:putative tryptophan/tyrosine transport system substrate-binding protein
MLASGMAGSMDRRHLIVGAGVSTLWPLAAAAQQQRKLRRILWVSTESQPDPFVDGFREGLKSLGYAEERDYAIELRYAPGNPEALRSVVEEITPQKVDLAISSGPAIQAMRRVIDVPVLFAISGDPVELGIVKSLARPEGNFTGSTFLSRDLAAKRVDLLKEIFPNVRKLAVLSNTLHPGERSEWQVTQQAAQTLGIEPAYLPFAGPREFDDALTGLGSMAADALLVFPEGVTMVNRKRLAQLAISRKLPSMFGWSEYCEAGGLLSYGANQRLAYVRLASYADRVFRGENPNNLPVEQPTKFELVVNLATAKALGIEVAPSILLRAERVIE